MSKYVRIRDSSGRSGRFARHAAVSAVIAVVSILVISVTSAAARPREYIIELPEATSAEGIARGRGATFYAGDLLAGDIFRGNLQKGTAELFIDAPEGRWALGLAFHRPSGLLFVAGGPTGQAYVYDTRTGETVATYQLGTPQTPPNPPVSVINDVTITKSGAWFTDSVQAQLYFVPIGRRGELGPSATLPLTGPAADTSGEFNLNGIAATRDGSTLIVAHTTNGKLYTVDPETGASAEISGVDVPAVDGIVFEAGRLWAVQSINQISVVDLSRDLTRGVVKRVIISDLFQTPSTAARFGSRLAVVNAKFDTGFPPTADTYEVVVVDA
jgi:sugar lactone lactonase YvrE